MPEEKVYIKEVQGHRKRRQRFLRFTGSATRAALVMLVAAVASIIIANTDYSVEFLKIINTEVGFVFGDGAATISIAKGTKEILFAIFFLLVGLEVKYEMTRGELSNVRQALLPIAAAFGGVMVPILIYVAFNWANPETLPGWAIPTATDIAFVLGILAILGNRVPNGIRVFLGTLMVMDDIIPIFIIAIFYGKSPDLLWLALAVVVYLVLIVLNRRHVYSLQPYLVAGIIIWVFAYMSGIHAAVVGIALAFVVPSGSQVNLKKFLNWSHEKIKTAREMYEPDVHIAEQKEYMQTVTGLCQVAKQVVPPATRLERKLYPWVFFLILPIFAFVNADVRFVDLSLVAVLVDPAFLGVFFGLVIGKPIGIVLVSFVLVKLKISKLPNNTNWMHIIGAGVLGGVGFTMAIFISSLAFSADPSQIAIAKIGIFGASIVSGLAGFAILFAQAKKAHEKGVSYIYAHSEATVYSHEDDEAIREGEQVLEELGGVELKEKARTAIVEKGGFVELVVIEEDDHNISYKVSSIAGDDLDDSDSENSISQ